MTVQLIEAGPVCLYSPGVARAMLRRESQHIALADRLRAHWQESEREKRHAAGLLLRMALDMSAASGPGFNGSFASIFPGAFQVIQTDLGITYGGTTLAAGTGVVAGTLTGSLATTSVPILFTCTTPGVIGSGAQFAASYDGGSSLAMTGIAPAVATPVPLTGKATGLSHAWAAGSALADNTWKATCAGLADQSGNAKHYTQATASKQPIITPGLNGKPAILGDGVDDFLASALNLPLPGTTPFVFYFVMRAISSALGLRICGGNAGASAVNLLFGNTTGGIRQGSSSGNFGVGMALNAWGAVTVVFTNSTADTLKTGAAASTTGVNSGNTVGTGYDLFSITAGGSPSNVELLAFIAAPIGVGSDVAFRAAVNSSAGFGTGNVLV